MPEINDRCMLLVTPYGGRYIALAFHIWRDYFFTCEWYKGKVGLEISIVFSFAVLDIVIILMARMTFAILPSGKTRPTAKRVRPEENCRDIYMTTIARTGAWDKSSMLSWEIRRSGIVSIKPSICSANLATDTSMVMTDPDLQLRRVQYRISRR